MNSRTSRIVRVQLEVRAQQTITAPVPSNVLGVNFDPVTQLPTIYAAVPRTVNETAEVTIHALRHGEDFPDRADGTLFVPLGLITISTETYAIFAEAPSGVTFQDVCYAAAP